MDIVFGLATGSRCSTRAGCSRTGRRTEIRDSAAVQEAYLGPGDRMDELFLE